ncbi:hypothetical protein PHMEG_00015874 [Phytophthora megakarya]|uniref:Integrase catalytic domain-containing protein n=1 Tax=Phytophthora megakarya TaxID=4795 RepID=A0A225W064_9STRA|nr:hypothetical protein PHMEG_00015874 [Phytophthora megakarya]
MQRLHLRAGDFVFPTLSEIHGAQQKHAHVAPVTAQRDSNNSLLVSERLWVPEKELSLLQRILIVAHCGAQCHRCIEPMMSTLTELFEIANLAQVCRRFLSRCLLCKERNELLHFDYLYLGDSMGTCQYVLVLKDGLTHFCELVACDSPTSVVTATAIVHWWKRFGASSVLVSDQGSHFKNELIAQVCKKLDIDQSLVVAYAPWINGTIERLNRDVLQVLRVLVMEYTLDTHEWVYLLPLVQGNLNHTPVRSLGDRAPSELFTGLQRPTPFEPILERGQHQREKRRLKNMARSKGSACNFSIGDFVLWSRIDSRLSTDKLKRYVMHGSRLKFYTDSSLEVNEEMLAHVANQGMVLGVQDITNHRKENGIWRLLASWEGLQSEEDSWEGLASLQRDVPASVEQYVHASDDPELTSAHSALVQAKRK